MRQEIAVHALHVTKEYPLYRTKADRLRAMLQPFYRPKRFLAIRDVNLDVYRGETVGVIGLNGAGKSTLVRMIAGLETPTSGTLQVFGKAQLLATSAGLDPNLTGRENIRYKCMLMGYTYRQINRIMNDIVSFAEIGSFIDQPFRTYSSGMRARLGFAISSTVDTDILIVDEALAVGDSVFFRKCIQRINEMRKSQKTIFYVAHSFGLMQTFCDRVVLVNNGMIHKIGEVQPVIDEYKKIISALSDLSEEERDALIKESESNRIRDSYRRDL